MPCGLLLVEGTGRRLRCRGAVWVPCEVVEAGTGEGEAVNCLITVGVLGVGTEGPGWLIGGVFIVYGGSCSSGISICQ